MSGRHVCLTIFLCSILMVPNEATDSGLEPMSAVLADLGTAALDSKEGAAAEKDDPNPPQGLVLGGGLPSIPADILCRYQENSYVELSELRPEKNQESFLYPEGWKKEVVPCMIKELVPVVVACAMWGGAIGQHILLHIDNMSVVDILHKGLTKEHSGVATHLLRCLSFFSAHYRFSISACHIPGCIILWLTTFLAAGCLPFMLRYQGFSPRLQSS